jgi:hypothetical protein
MLPFYVESLCGLEVENNLKEWGLCVFYPNLLDISDLRGEASDLLSQAEKSNGGEYSPGFAEKVFVKSSLEAQTLNFPNICGYFGLPIFRTVFDKLSDNAGTYCEDVYMTKEIHSDRGLARNGYLHFDRNWAFKILVYLSDVEEGCGPFSAVPKSHHLGKSLRQLGWDKYNKFEKIPNRADIDFPDVKKLLGDVQPIYGKAGTVIIFNSDVFHLGGVVKPGKERWIIRSHSRSWHHYICNDGI